MALVNGDPITNFDIEQRAKLIELSTHKPPPRTEVINELINEKLKIQLLRRYQHRGHRQGRRQRLRQHGAAHARDAERIHRQSFASRASRPKRSNRA